MRFHAIKEIIPVHHGSQSKVFSSATNFHYRPVESRRAIAIKIPRTHARAETSVSATDSKWRNVGTSIYLYQNSEIETLKLVFDIVNEKHVLQFILKNSFLIALLFEAYAHIEKYFPYTKIKLRLSFDKESENEPQLVAEILTSMEYEIATTQLENLDDKWWLNSFHKYNNKFFITLNFI